MSVRAWDVERGVKEEEDREGWRVSPLGEGCLGVSAAGEGVDRLPGL